MNKFKKNKGITLVALIITIIVLLILAVVSIRAVTGDGIISHAKNARTEYGKAQTEEQDMLSKYEYEIAKAQGAATGSYKDYLLQKEYEKKIESGELPEYVSFENYAIDKYSLGTATNVDNYGKVVNYKSKGEGLDTLVWKLFYQDEKNVYLISQTADGKYSTDTVSWPCDTSTFTFLDKPDYLSKYSSGADLSLQGIALNKDFDGLMRVTDARMSDVITAYLCDTSVWEKYTDEAGKALYAIGSPTVQLFAASYNTYNVTSLYKVNGLGATVYYVGPESKFSISKECRNGLYNIGCGDRYILATPSYDDSLPYGDQDIWFDDSGYNSLRNDIGLYAPKYIRPVVCIPVSEFNYTLSD